MPGQDSQSAPAWIGLGVLRTGGAPACCFPARVRSNSTKAQELAS